MAAKPLKVYLDTSIFNFLLTADEDDREITTKALNEIMKIGALYISEVVIREINAAAEPKRSQLTDKISFYSPKLLLIDNETQSLAAKYIAEGVIPEKYADDARHIAIATVYGIEVIVSWNFEHIVKLKTRREVNGINLLSGYREIEICSPEEVF